MWEQLRNLREGKSLSLSDLAHLSGIPVATLGAWENETPTSVLRLGSICEALEESPNALLGYQASELETDETVEGGATIVNSALEREDWELIHGYLCVKEKQLREDLLEGPIDLNEAQAINSIYKTRSKIEKILGPEGA